MQAIWQQLFQTSGLFQKPKQKLYSKSFPVLLSCLKFSSSKGVFLLMQWHCLPICHIILWCFCDAVLVTVCKTLGVKGKNKQIEPEKASRDVFRNIFKLFRASLLSIASSCFYELYSDELTFEVGLLFPGSHSSISCYLLTLIPHFRISIWTSLFHSHQFAHSWNLVFLLEAQLGMLSYTDC